MLSKDLQLLFAIVSATGVPNFQFPGNNQRTGQLMKYKRAMIGKNRHVHSKELETINLHFD